MSRGLIGAGRYERSDERTTGATATATAPSTPASGRCNCASQSYGKGVVIRFQSTRLRQRAAARRLSARRNRLPSSVALCHVGVVARRIGAVIPIAGVGSGPVVAAVWVIVIRPAPSGAPPLRVIVIRPAPSTAPPGAEGGDDNKSTAEAVVIKTVEFAETRRHEIHETRDGTDRHEIRATRDETGRHESREIRGEIRRHGSRRCRG